MKRLITIAIVALGLMGCAKSQPSDNLTYSLENWNLLSGKGNQQNPIPSLIVVGPNGEPIANAEVLIGETLDLPFEDNFLVTDINGSFEIPQDWNDPQPVTISATGYIRATFLAQTPVGQFFRLRKIETIGQYELAGTTSGYGNLSNDGFLDFGLVIPAMTKKDFFSFNIASVISPVNDTMSVAGEKVYVPSNIALPTQKESYGIFPVTLGKEAYRLFYTEPGQKNVYSLRGQFPFKKVVDELRNNKEFYELLNYFTMKSGSVTQVDINSKATKQNLKVNDIPFNQKVGLTVGAFDPSYIMLAVALTDINGMLFPSDVKRLFPNQAIQLATPGTGSIYILNAIKLASESTNQNFKERVSAAVVPYQKNSVTTPNLPLIADPKVIDDTTVEFYPPQSKDVSAIATHAILSKVSESTISGVKMQYATGLWDVYASSWITEVSLPEWPTTQAIGNSGLRWEVSFIGSNQPTAGFIGPQSIESATHVTKSSVDF
jgi:hypothetical protein